MDVDGVVAPVHGKTAWGDDVVAGRLFGPVLVSPTLCARLDVIAAAPDVTGFWLTDWPPEARARMDPFPGRDWASIARPPPSPTGRTWTKWPAIQAWLDDHPEITTLVWCDDHLNRTRRATVRSRLGERGVRNLLLTPATSVGLTPQHLVKVAAMLGDSPRSTGRVRTGSPS
jgi:hypothetical protein